MTETRSKLARLLIAAALVVPTVVATAVVPSAAAPTQQEVEDAKARLSQLMEELAAVNERWNEARYQLAEAQKRLAEAKARKEAAESEAAKAREALEARAVAAYTDMGSQFDALLSADTMTEFSDRLEFLGAITETDAQLAARADNAAQQAEWAAQEYDKAVGDAQAQANALAVERSAAQANLDEQRQLAAELDAEYQAAVEAQQRALDTPPTPDPPSSDGGGFVPPPNASGAQIAIAAARSKLGASYVFGAAGPDVFDCSGFVLWSWAQAGVSLPHSALAQYTSLPRVPLSAVQPGDIIYYGNYGPHTALYIGGGQIIHIRNPSPGGVVQIDSMYGYDDPWGATRPG
jgi:cell wall-associated NlpC family hydrolase